MNAARPTCTWCPKPATTSVEIAPAGTKMIQTPGGKRSVGKPARTAPACADHANPDPSDSRNRGDAQIPGQLDIFDVLGDAA